MSGDNSSLDNFPNSLEEALDYAIVVPSPSFENIIEMGPDIDISHEPPIPSIVDMGCDKPLDNTANEVSHPPVSFLCMENLKSDSVSNTPSSNLESGNSVEKKGILHDGVCSSSSQTPEFPFFQSFEWFRQKYPEFLYPVVFKPPIQLGRACFFVPTQIDDQILENYRSIDSSCVPIPAGFWSEMGRVDSAMNLHYKIIEDFLPNEE